MATLNDQLEQVFRSAVTAALGDDYAGTDPQIRPTGDPKFGDYQANLAMNLAKQLNQKPRQVAKAIVEHISAAGLVQSLEIAGPGFINITIHSNALNQLAADMLEHPKLGIDKPEQPKRIVVDYSSPNVAKEMHVGHLRSTVIGDAIVRVLDFQGHDVIRQNHLGDWGTQFGMLLEHLVDLGVRPHDTPPDVADLNRFYQDAKKKFDAEPEFADRSRKRVVAMQSLDNDTILLWQILVDESKKHFFGVYNKLGVMLEESDIRAESQYNNDLHSVIDQLKATGHLQESLGATVVYPEGFTDRDGKPMPMIVQKTDGGYLYATTDLAAARYRITQLQAQRIIYVTDSRQAQHFAMVFQTLQQTGWATGNVRLDHVPFGTILGPDRKPFKTRSGETIKLIDLIDEALSRARAVIEQKNPDLDDALKAEIADTVGIGALKYADLCNDRIKDYVFDWNRMLALDGNTAPYLQNAYVRVRSIFRKGEIDPDSLPGAMIQVDAPAERLLVLKLLQFNQVIDSVADSLEPHRLCTFLYELATLLHQFYEQCPVLTAPDKTTKNSRLAICHLVGRTLETGLSLLGIDIVQQM